MVRIGKYTGNVYEDNQIHLMDECGILISDSKKDDKIFCENIYRKILLHVQLVKIATKLTNRRNV